jgi:hypothetical protein
MKKLLPFFLVLITATSFAQYNNSWIDYSKTYYKFKVAKTGLYRITQASLSGIGLGSTPAEQFQLWRNGEEVRLYTSTPTGPLGGAGYIEFWGMMNDGKKDTKLYTNPDFQLSDHWSLESDTASYFLTVNPLGTSLRFNNTLQGPVGGLTPEPYFMSTQGVYYKDVIYNGYAVIVGFYVYSSDYDKGEGWTSTEIYSANRPTITFQGLNLYNSGPTPTFSINAAGVVINNNRTFQVLANNASTVIDTTINGCDYVKMHRDVPFSMFTNTDNITFNVFNVTGSTTDRIVLGQAELKYPSTFNFNNQKNFSFELPAAPAGNYLVIDNFNYGSTAPTLMDFNTGNRYTGDISTPGKVKFVLPPSTGGVRKFILVSEDASNIMNAGGFVTRNFVDYTNSANQGDYLIISNSILYNDGSGNNYVDQYRQYRASVAGGSYNAKVCDIDQLTDQFGFGIKTHPESVKNFIQFAKGTFTVAPKFIFIIGKGVTYPEYAGHQDSQYADRLNLVPCFGFPGSDILLSSDYTTFSPQVPIGRLTCIKASEVKDYLQKMQQYELAQASALQTIDNKGWMKNVLHLAGGKDSIENRDFSDYLRQLQLIIEDTLYGAKVTAFSKSSTAAVQLVAEQTINNMFAEGFSLLGYLGHSSATLLEFNLGSPDNFSNAGKYPFFNVSGCTAGNVYTYDSTRFLGPLSISEEYVLANQKGCIGMLASSHLGLPPILDTYNKALYHNISSYEYGNPIGVIIKKTTENVGGTNSFVDYFTRLNLEQLNLNGDPALRINSHRKPDYVEEDPLVQISPSFVSVADGSFTVNIKTKNIGRAVNDSITWKVRHIYPDGTDSVFRKRIKGPNYSDSLILTYSILPTRDKGLNKIEVTIDADGNVDELSESNNTVTKEFYIYEDEARPVYPYNFAIINTNTSKLIASTANPFSPMKQYQMELDTTENFNSSAKVTKTISSVGGILEFDPGITYQDGRVYYWRVAIVPSSGAFHWNNSSFVYLSTGGPGFNQSHYFQHLKSDTISVSLQPNRKWKFGSIVNEIAGRNGVVGTAIQAGSEFAVLENNTEITQSVCNFSTIVFNVLDSISLKPWLNNPVGQPGLYGSNAICNAQRLPNFEFDLINSTNRKAAADFLNNLPNGVVVIVRSVTSPNPLANTYAPDWDGDAITFGGNQYSIAWQLRTQGFTTIDNYTQPLAFIFMYQKNTPSFNPSYVFSVGTSDKINLYHNYLTPDTLGFITSPKFGPARAWKEMHWRGTSEEPNSPDKPTVSLIGFNINGNVDTLLTVDQTLQDVDISFVNAATYPYLEMRMRNVDSIKLTPYQLDYWRLNYDPVPEGAIAPNIFLTKKDTLEQGEKLSFGIAFKNISPTAFPDSIKMKAYIIDANNQTSAILLPKQRPLIPGAADTLKFDIDTRNLSGLNTLYVDFNPDNDQPEQYLFNNFLYMNFFVNSDRHKPLLDVTFDGVHVLNRDIVSTKPHIVIKIKDESKYLQLDDTSRLKVQLRYPDGNLKTINYLNNSDTLKFTPANLATGDNTATIEFNPYLQVAPYVFDGDEAEYQLLVTGKDAANNPAGNINYNIDVRVIDKPMISNLLNYPNPFTTSTAFVFTLTGSEIPSNLKIQILTVTGKVVREITKNELGPIHIGRNITEFKWDGTDSYGQKLANGVYLYRFVTNLHGQTMQKFTDSGDNTDKYFTKGYGKMYLMR